jgi:hypothetical protein
VSRSELKSLCDARPRFWIKRSWTGLWWVALDPDEPLALFDTSTIYRAWTRERLVAKLERMTAPRATEWEDVRV